MYLLEVKYSVCRPMMSPPHRPAEMHTNMYQFFTSLVSKSALGCSGVGRGTALGACRVKVSGRDQRATPRATWGGGGQGFWFWGCRGPQAQGRAPWGVRAPRV